ncbi:DUF4352 domain-containing protein [Microbacterium caowuchunii]|uniref:DUF4352 domain-containing protein n=1 Tax=Microbacterium caowuchunii TaxID=2614638 RepID=UPI0012441F47|nr:DUF4352 domain-containing protein [Microbacterium caowuchunii]QEW01236.1 DUF4352 domain-containing protein [Microbacterium caowuchunii]
MRRTHALSLAAVVTATMLTAGCGAAAAPDSDRLPDTAPVATASPTQADDPDQATYGDRILSDRGNLVKEVGQLAGMTLGEDSAVPVAQFVVTDIVVDIACTDQYADPPKNGHFVGIHLNVETTPELAQAEIGTVTFSEWVWQAFDANGTRVNDPLGNASWCMDSGDRLPLDIGPGQSVAGWVVLDLPTDHGSVAYLPWATTGWEWAY